MTPETLTRVGPSDLLVRFAMAETLPELVARARSHRELWRDMTARARVPQPLVDRARRLGRPYYLLVLLEDWCGDAINTIPALAALADAVPGLQLRVLERDRNPDLMDAHLTGTSRSIPVVVALDAEGREIGWWGPRPAELQRWAPSAEARARSGGDRYREIRRWYARDGGRTTVGEVLELLERDAAAHAVE
jgi:hypothetical protein